MYLTRRIFPLLNLLIRVLRLANDLVPIPLPILALTLFVRLRVLSLSLVLPLIPNLNLNLILVFTLILLLVFPLILILVVTRPSLQIRTSFTMNPLLFLLLHLLFEIPLLLFNRRPHALLRVWYLAYQVHLHRNTSRQDRH